MLLITCSLIFSKLQDIFARINFRKDAQHSAKSIDDFNSQNRPKIAEIMVFKKRVKMLVSHVDL